MECTSQIIYKPSLEQSFDGNKNVVFFFVGDVQDFYANMMKQAEYSQFAKNWSLESTSELLHKRFPRSDIILVRPSRMDGPYSCYDKFVDNSTYGIPLHLIKTNGKAWSHLLCLLQAVPVASPFRICLIGFSKGCVVLNQLIYELCDPALDQDSLANKVERFIWLDGGHAGHSTTWINEPHILKAFAAYCNEWRICLDVRVTPYQVMCRRRPWIGKQEKKFVEILSKTGVTNLREYLYFADEPGTLYNHFKIIDTLP